MNGLTHVTIDFQSSHLLFPTLIGIVLAILGVAAIIKRRGELASAGARARAAFGEMDRPRLFGTLALTVVYFSLMTPVGDFWPNTGYGFLFCSIPFVFLSGLLFMHERPFRQVATMAAIAIAAPTLVWWLFAEVFFLTLP